MRAAYPVTAVATVATMLHRPMPFGDGDADDSADNDGSNEDDGEGTEDSAAEAAAAAAAADAKAIETQARAQGWRPEAEFKGDGKWVDAATFVERGTKFKKSLETQIASLTLQVAESKKTNAAFAKFHKEAMERKDAELTEAIRKARLDHKEAIRNGEDEDALTLEDRIDTLKEEKAKLKDAPPADTEAEPEAKGKAPYDGAEPDAVLTAWVDDGNEWFRDNARLRAYAMAIGQELRANGDKRKDTAFLDQIKKQMEADLPGSFPRGNPLRNKASATEAGGPATSTVRGKTERDLPKEDRALMRKFVAEGFMSAEQFLKDYNWS